VLRRYVHGTGANTPLIAYEDAGLNDMRELFADRQGSIVGIAGCQCGADDPAAAAIKPLSTALEQRRLGDHRRSIMATTRNTVIQLYRALNLPECAIRPNIRLLNSINR
jgi:hypothetical protein